MADQDNGTTKPTPEMLYGTFYPQFDIPVIILWSFIILAGLGNWVLFWCFLKTKALRNPFNMIVLALAFSNSISTTLIGPMQLSRVFVLYRPVSDAWCNTRIVLKTFCFSVSLLVLFIVAAVRLYAGLSRKQLKLTYKKMGCIVFVIYALSVLASPSLLDKDGATYNHCMGQVDIERIRATLKGNSDDSIANYREATTLMYNNITNIPLLKFEQEDIEILFTVTPGDDMSSFNSSVKNVTANNSVTKAPTRVWEYCFFVVSIALFLATVFCCIALVIVLKKRENAIKDTILTNKRNILTVKVTAYVTSSFFISFLLPFFPSIVTLPVEGSPANLHYIAMFHCLSSFDAALTPLIYYFTNTCYRNALTLSMPTWVKKVCCCSSTQVGPMSQTEQPGTSRNTSSNGQVLHISPAQPEQHRDQIEIQ